MPHPGFGIVTRTTFLGRFTQQTAQTFKFWVSTEHRLDMSRCQQGLASHLKLLVCCFGPLPEPFPIYAMNFALVVGESDPFWLPCSPRNQGLRIPKATLLCH